MLTSPIFELVASVSAALMRRAALTMAALLLGAMPAFAADINVDSDCTLAQAIASANNNSAPSGSTCEDGDSTTDTSDKILLSADVTLSAALPAITSSVGVWGNGCRSGTSSANCVIDGGGAYRIFDVEASAGSGGLSVQFLTLTNGAPTAGGGGAIRIKGSSVTVSDSVISNSVAGATSAHGGAILVTSGAISLTVQNSTITGNSSSNQSGGAISIAGGVNSVNNSSARVRIDNSIITDNSANTKGGGIYVGTGADNVEIIDSEITSNEAANGGGVYVDSSGADVEFSGASIEDNEASGAGGGLYLNSSSTAEIEKSAFKDNSSGSNGGGIYSTGALTLQNSTFSANAASASQGSGGGLYIGGGTATIQHVTVAGSTAASGGQALHHTSATLHLYNNLLAGSGALCSGNATISSNAGNLIQDNTCSPAVSGDPLLAPFAGAPLYFPLLANSPAIDAASEDHCLSDDQRGVARTAASCDIGAYEGSVAAVGAIIDVVTPVRETSSESESSGGRGADEEDEESRSEAIEPPVCTGEILHATSEIRVSVANGLCSGAQFNRVDATGVGDATVIAMGIIDAVDVWSWVEQGVEVCFPQVGSLVFLDAATAPRTVREHESYENASGMTCGYLKRAGTLVLAPGTPTHAYSHSPALQSCRVFVTAVLNFRETPGGVIKGLIPAYVTLTVVSSTTGWYEVDYYGAVGWISADYVETRGDCGG